MKKHKKLLAIILSTVLVLSLNVAAFAGGAAPGFQGSDGVFTGSGNVLFTDEESEEVKLYVPTSLSFDFILDPLGIVEQAKTANGAPFTLDPDADPEVIFLNDEIEFGAESYAPLSLGFSAKMEDQGGIVYSTDGTFADDDTLELYINFEVAQNGNVVPKIFADLLTNSKAHSAGTFDGTGELGAIDDNGTDFSFVIPECEYGVEITGFDSSSWPWTFTATPIKEDDDEVYGTALKAGGEMTKGSDWSAYAGVDEIRIVTKFEIDLYSGAAPVYEADTAWLVSIGFNAPSAPIVYTWSALGAPNIVGGTNATSTTAIPELVGATVTGADYYTASSSFSLGIVTASPSVNNTIRNNNGILTVRLGNNAATDWTKIVLTLDTGTEITINR